jgi:hypothetical protein
MAAGRVSKLKAKTGTVQRACHGTRMRRGDRRRNLQGCGSTVAQLARSGATPLRRR